MESTKRAKTEQIIKIQQKMTPQVKNIGTCSTKITIVPLLKGDFASFELLFSTKMVSFFLHYAIQRNFRISLDYIMIIWYYIITVKIILFL